jgi:hypothetical protein
VSLERSWPGAGSKDRFSPQLGLRPAPDPNESFKIPKIDDVGALSIRNFVFMMVPMLKSRFEPKCLVACVACGLEATKIEKM